MIKALGADRLASLTAQRYTGGPLPVPADRPDALRLVIPLDQLDALCLSAAGPRLRVETVGTDDLDGLPGLDVNTLVAGGLTELGLALPAELTGAGWVRLVSLLATAREHGVRVDWTLPTAGPDWARADNLHHLPPPRDGNAGEVGSWTRRHAYGQLYWRKGPGFLSVIDARRDPRERYVIDDERLLNVFLRLGAPLCSDELDGGNARALAELLDAGLAVTAGGWATRLPYRLLHWPMPSDYL